MSFDKPRLPTAPAPPAGIGRRELLQVLLGASAAGFVGPAIAAGHPLHDHLNDPSRIAQADARAAAADWKPEFLSAHEVETMRVLAERIVPGASRANSVEFIDQLLAVDSSEHQREFLNALGALEARARAKGGKPWKALTAEAQDEILTEASTAASGKPPEPVWTPGQPIEPRSAPAEVTLTLRDHFDLLKDWIAGAYYSSEIGMRELGWTGRVVFDSFPGCPHPEGHP